MCYSCIEIVEKERIEQGIPENARYCSQKAVFVACEIQERIAALNRLCSDGNAPPKDQLDRMEALSLEMASYWNASARLLAAETKK